MEKEVIDNIVKPKERLINGLDYIDCLLAKHLGWFFYPASKQGKEKKHRDYLEKMQR